MKKWYVSAELFRASGERDEIGASNSLIFCGRVKTLVAASSPKEAIEAGKKAISASIEDNMEATRYGCMDLDSIAKLGDTEIYANMHTV